MSISFDRKSAPMVDFVALHMGADRRFHKLIALADDLFQAG